MCDDKPVWAFVCGSRKWSDEILIRRELRKLPAFGTLLQGGSKGADSLAAKIGHELGMNVITEEANWDAYKKKAGPIRNTRMLQMLERVRKQGFVVHCFAFFNGKRPKKKSGTNDMVNKLLNAGFSVWTPVGTFARLKESSARRSQGELKF
ncbi:MAG: SLOG family protein [Planctomycetota bacterium]|jgi:hypothetical protein